MFDWVEKHKRWIQIGLLVLIVPSFAFFGINYYFNEYGDAGVVAKVAGTKISEQEFDAALRERQEQLRQMMKDKADSAMLDSNEVRNAVINGLVEKRALLAHALHSGMTVPDEAVQKVIAGISYFQDPKTGKFSIERYHQLLKGQGMTPVMFEDRIRHDLRIAQSSESVTESAFVSVSVASRLGQIREQRREVSEWSVTPDASLMKRVSVTDEDVKKEYDTHPENFRIPARARVEYVTLTPDVAGKGVKLTDEEIKAAYEAERSRYETPEERKASHILIAVPRDADAAARSDAKKRATEIAEEVKKSPGRFAEIARSKSEDPGSAKAGGDLGFFPRGQMVKPFDEALFQMKPGQIEGPVETEYGYHIIRLDAVKPGEVTPLSAVRNEIEEELRKPKLSKLFADKAEQFQELVYSQSDSLKPAADSLGLPVETSDWITPSGLSSGPLSNKELLKRIFSDDSIKNKRNTEAVEIDRNTLAAARVVDYRPASLLPFEDVKSDVRKYLEVQKAAKLVEEEGQSALERARASGGEGFKWSDPKEVSLGDPAGLPPEAARDVFSAEATKLPVFLGVSGQGGRYTIYRVSRIINGPPLSEPDVKLLEQQIAQIAAQQQLDAYVQAIKGSAGVTIDNTKVEKRAQP